MVDNTNCPVTDNLLVQHGLFLTKQQQLILCSIPVQVFLPAVFNGWRHLHFLWSSPPCSSRNDRPLVGPEPHRIDAPAILFTQQLSHIDHLLLRHIRCPGIANMGVMLPYHCPCTLTIEFHQLVQSRNHMAVPDVPGIRVMPDHRPVVRFRTLHGHGVELRA
ncbi:hypothetical protein D3C75_719820 [compost metagenome]